jgi:hypothetical protein
LTARSFFRIGHLLKNEINMHPSNEKSNFGLTLAGRIIHGSFC